MSLKYKVGNKVRIKNIDWYNKNSDEYGDVDCGTYSFTYGMAKFCGKIVTIHHGYNNGCYTIKEDDNDYTFTNEMIEGLVEEETLIKRVDDKGLPFNEWLSHKGAFHVPDGYELKDDNGNIINTKKIVLEKKKGYPKTYAECSLINGCEGRISLKIIGEFTRLINARNAYWKIAGEEMGLEKSWEPDFNHINRKFYCIYNSKNNIVKNVIYSENKILIFPTAEMRDAFYENFKDLIERCKELL